MYGIDGETNNGRTHIQTFFQNGGFCMETRLVYFLETSTNRKDTNLVSVRKQHGKMHIFEKRSLNEWRNWIYFGTDLHFHN